MALQALLFTVHVSSVYGMFEGLVAADGGVFRVVDGKRQWVFNPPASACEEATGNELGGNTEEGTGGTAWEGGGVAKG